MNNKLIISDFYKNILFGFYFEDDKLQRLVNLKNDNVVGNIYCGYVKDVVKNINGAFVLFDDNKKGYLSLKDFKNPVKQGDKVLVQVSGDKIKTKDYSLTSRISLNSECLVLTVGNTDISVSRKIKDKDIREELKSTLSVKKNDVYGFIIRTNALDFSKEDILKQADDLINQLEDLKKRFAFVTPKAALLKKDYLQDLISEFKKHGELSIITDVVYIYDTLKEHNDMVTYNDNSKISLCNKYSLETHLNRLLSKKVWLKSGGYLIIDETEAMTVIDVNSGKAVSQESFIKTNKEAAEEVARQIRLRNISGMIIVDFINTKGENDAQNLSNLLRNYISKDRVKTRIIGMTELGLMQLTRQKIRKPLSKYILCECPYCKGSGKIFLPEMIAEKIKTEIINVFTNTIYNKVTVSSNATIIKNLKAIFSMSNNYKDNITFNTIETSKADYYLIEKFKK